MARASDKDMKAPHTRRLSVAPIVTVAVLLAVWQLVCSIGLVPSYLLPSPVEVVVAFVGDFGLLMSHTASTIVEALLGLAIGVAVGFVVAVLMDRFEVVYRALDPLVTISQTVPTVAIAPLLVLWFGYGIAPKVLLVVLTTFFPITVALSSGFRSVDADVIDLMRTMNATRWQVFRYAKLPAAADQFFSGLRISATYAMVGAVIAEWLGGFNGLGVYMTRVRKSYSYDKMFAVILLISALSLALMGLVSLLERVCMPWKRAERKSDQ
jgi:ABC-type nitrate/sulfonate/bicarbonate transport system permease component